MKRNPASGLIGYLVLVSSVAAIGGFLFGFDVSIISGAILFLREEWGLNPSTVGIVTGSAILGCPFGAFIGTFFSDRWGRRPCLILSAGLFFISAVGSGLALAPLDFSFWRFIGGIGVGLASTVSPMYIAELSPARLRGRMVILNQLAIVVGLTLSIYVAYLLSFGGHWRWMFSVEALPAAVLGIALFFVPRSPRWLAIQGRDDEALEVLCRINTPEQSAQDLAAIREELGKEEGSFREIFTPGIRRAVLIGILLMVFSQINGVNMILIYAPALFVEAGVTNASDAILNSIYVTSWITLCTVASFWIIARFGRRTILIAGPIGMALGELIIFARIPYSLPAWTTLVGMFVATGSFTLTLAPLSWVVLSELFPNRIRGVAMSLATTAMFTASFITTYFFPVLLETFKVRFGSPFSAFLIFASICLLCSLFIWLMLPETKDKTLEEIGEYWLSFQRKSKKKI